MELNVNLDLINRARSIASSGLTHNLDIPPKEFPKVEYNKLSTYNAVSRSVVSVGLNNFRAQSDKCYFSERFISPGTAWTNYPNGFYRG